MNTALIWRGPNWLCDLNCFQGPCWLGDWVHACCRIARENRGIWLLLLREPKNTLQAFMPLYGANLPSTLFLHHAPVSFTDYQQNSTWGQCQVFNWSVPPMLEKWHSECQGLLLKSVSPSVHFNENYFCSRLKWGSQALEEQKDGKTGWSWSRPICGHSWAHVGQSGSKTQWWK